MRLCFVIKSLSIEAGGAERVLCDISSELARRGHLVEIASFDERTAVDFYSLDPAVGRNRLGIGKVETQSGLFEFVRRILALRSLMIAKRPDVAIGFMHSSYVPLGVACLGTGVRVIASEHSPHQHYRKRPLEKLLIHAIAQFCARFTTTLENVRLGFPAALGDRMTVIPNPVGFRPRPRKPPEGDRRRLLFVANFRAEKDHRTLVAAFARLAQAHPSWDLRLVGEGNLRPRVERLVEQLGLQSRVTFTGALTDLSDEYAQADLFASPSVYESFGLATAEALASGLAVIGFADCPATNHLVENGINGILVQGPDRADALAEGLDRVMRSDQLRKKLGRAAPQTIERYSIKSVADQWEELLKGLDLRMTCRLEGQKSGRDLIRNIAIHNRLSRNYERIHGEIFNEVEQGRLHSLLERALAEVRSSNAVVEALDFGCGSGNLTAHLLALGAKVTAADVATGFLELVRERYKGSRLETHELNGRDLCELEDQSFDLVATYSVLHHIPNYLSACAEMARVCRKGGVVVIDHEASPNAWKNDEVLARFRREASRLDWRKYVQPANYVHRFRRLFDNRYSNEGDIHVWPDDHIEWDLVVDVMQGSGCLPVLQDDYLLYRKLYREEVYDRFSGRCFDTRAMIFRRG